MAERQVFVRLSVRDADRALAELKKVGIQGDKSLGRLPPAAKRASKGMRGLDTAMREARGSAQAFAGRMGPLGAALGALGPGGLAAAAGIGATAVALRGATRLAVQAADEFKQLADTADLVGFTVEQLQALRFAGEQVGVGIRTTDLALQRFSRRIAEVAQGEGELEKVATQYGIQLRDNEGQMRSNAEILGDFADVIQNAESRQEALRIGFKLFDSEGARFALTLRDGREGLEAFAREAQDLGLIIDEAVVREAGRASNRLRTMQRVIDTQLKVAVVGLADEITAVTSAFAGWVLKLDETLERLDLLNTRSLRALKAELSDVETRLAQLQAVEQQGPISTGLERLHEFLNPANLISGLVPEEAARFLPGTGEPGGLSLQERQRRLGRMAAALRARIALLQNPPEADGPERSNVPAPPTADDRKKAERLAEANREVVETLQFELEQLDRTTRQRAIATAQRRLNEEATEAQREAVARFAGALFDEKRAQEEKAEADRRAQQLAEEGRRLTASLRTPAEEYAAELERINKLLEAEAINQETANRARKAAAETLRESRDEVSKLSETADETARIVVNFFDGAIDRTHTWTEALDRLEGQLLNVGNRVLLLEPFEEFLRGSFRQAGGGGLGGLIGSFGGEVGRQPGDVSEGSGLLGLASQAFSFLDVFHRGGRAGGPAPTRAVPTAALAGAPHFQSGSLPGIGRDEFPAVLHRGEVVLNKQQSDALRTGGGDRPPGGGDVINLTMNVQTPDAQSFRQSEGQIMAEASRALERARRRER